MCSIAVAVAVGVFSSYYLVLNLVSGLWMWYRMDVLDECNVHVDWYGILFYTPLESWAGDCVGVRGGTAATAATAL